MKNKIYLNGFAGRLLFTLAMSLLMMFIFMPSAAFAEGEGDGNEPEWNMLKMECTGEWNRLYSDGTLDFVIYDASIPEGKTTDDLDVSIGRYNEENDEMEWDCWDMDAQDLYSFTADGNELIITLDGEAAQNAGAQPYEWVTLSVVCGDPEADGWGAGCGFEFREARVWYDLPESQTILPGWDGSVDGRIGIHVENAEHPDGLDYDIFADDIVPADEADADAADELFEDHHIDSDEEGRVWYYFRARNAEEEPFGEVSFSVMYKDIDGEDQTETVSVSVTNDVFFAEMQSENGTFNALPDSDISLRADVTHMFCRRITGEGEDRYEYGAEHGDDEGVSGFSYTWKIEDGEDLAELQAVDGYPYLQTLRIDSDPEINDNVRVSVSISYNGDEVVFTDRNFEIRPEYTEIWPVDLDRQLEVGDSITTKFEVRQYDINGTSAEGYDNGYKIVEDVSFRWGGYDANCVSIKDNNGDEVISDENADGDTFTIKRLGDWDTDLNLAAEWTDGEDTRECWQNYHLNGVDCRIEDTEHDQDVYTDAEEAPSVVFDAMLGSDWQNRLDVVVTVGKWNGRADEWEEIYKNKLLKSYYTEDRTDDSITVTLSDSFFKGIEDYTDIRVTAEVYLKGAEKTDDNRIAETDSWLHIRPARTEYYFTEDRDLLASRDELNIERYFDVYVENSEYPYGENLRCEVTDVDILNESPESAGKKVIRNFRKDYRDDNEESEDYWWHMEAATAGTATVRVTYDDPAELGGETGKTYEFNVTVTEDVYDLWINTEDGRYMARPGDTVTLVAEAIHRTRQGDSTEGLSYAWEVVNGSEFAEIEQSADPSRAVVTFKLPSGYDTEGGYWEDIDVECRLYDGSDEVKARDSKRLNITESYADVFPALIDDLEVGESVTVTPEVRLYPGSDGAEYDNASDVEFEWYYDDNAVSVTDENGAAVGNTDDEDNYIGSVDPQEFTITRLREWDTNIHLNVSWTDGEDRRFEERDYWLNWKECRLESREHDIWIAADTAADRIPEAVFDLWLGSGWQDRLDVVLTAGIWNNDDETWDETFDTGAGREDLTLRKADDEYGITVSESLLERFASTDEEDHVRIFAEVYRKDDPHNEENRLADSDLWMHFFDPEVNYVGRDWFDMIVGDSITLTESSRAWIRNAGNPDGGYVRYTINDVTLTDNNDGAVRLDVNNEGGRTWEIEAAANGYAEAKVSFTRLDGTDDEYTLHFSVGEDIISARMVTEGDVYEMTPGSSAQLNTIVTLRSSEGESDISGRSDLSYEWDVTQGSEYITLTESGSTAAVTFADASEDEWLDEFIRVEVRVKSNEGGDLHEVAYADYEFRYVNEYDRIICEDIDPEMHIGSSVTVTPQEIRHYPGNGTAYDVIDDAKFEWEYDNDSVSISEKDGSYIIKRIRRADTSLRLKASWDDNEGYERETDAWFFLSGDAECDHEYGDASYEWSEDCKKVTASHTCMYDGFEETETVDATSVYTSAACETPDSTVYTAEFSKNGFTVQTKEVTGEALGHKEEVLPAKPASCTEPGLTAGTRCTVCGKILEEQQEIPATGQHSYGEWTVTKAATCTEAGVRTRTCTVCGDAETEAIAMADHSYGEWTVTKAATCTEAGSRVKECTVCHDKVTEAIPATGHDLTRVEAMAATTEAEGNIEYWTCSECSKIFSDAEGKTEITKDKTVIPKKTEPADEEKPAEPTEEEKAAAAAKEILSKAVTEAKKLVKDNYTDDSYKALQDAIAEAEALIENNSAAKAQLDAAASKIAATISALKEKPVEPTEEEKAAAAAKEILNKAVTEAKKLVKGNYTDDSYKALQDAIAEAEALVANNSATKAQLDAAASKIAATISALKEKEDPAKQMGADGTALGEGASVQAAEAAIAGMSSDNDLPGSVFNKLQLKSSKQTNTSITISWKKINGAASYVIYGNKCGKSSKMQRLAASTGKTKKFTSVLGKKLKKGTYYKFMIVALDKNNNVVSSSKIIHVATKGGKVGNVGKITTKAKKNKASVKKGKTFKLAAKQVAASKKLKVKNHRVLKYESTNPKIATVSSKGVIKGVKKGKCKVYVYAQNGVYSVISVTVK